MATCIPTSSTTAATPSVNGHGTTTAGDGSSFDAIVVGAGHNGLTAAAYLARAGMRVCVLESRELVGGACVTEEVWPGRRVSRASYVVSMLQHTGENVCYISGGATTPGGGNTSALYRYDPATQTVVNLGNYTHHTTGFDFHFSWWVPWVEGGAICVAGGVDANSVVIADSECYYIGPAVFGAPNADLGPLPQPWWGGADGWKIVTSRS